ncbi:hypothetical protein RSOLAG1IB_12189 [Rhizoctonia solani AG-1 IB]|nr:hypothetical protein RSOLAG1IB_12189 [Rhizoctonia solani AG-1 IB]
MGAQSSYSDKTMAVGPWMVKPSATDSTARAVATLIDATTHHTSAPCAEPPTTAHKSAPCNLRKVVTPLLSEAWEAELQSLDLLKEFGDVPVGLRTGFRLGTSSPITTTYIPDNHLSALSHPNIILNHINTELNAGRYSGPFSKSTLINLIGPF